MKGPFPHRQTWRSRWDQQGLTLMELLVVVGVIAVLAALLLPVLSGARAKARAARCAGNLRQFGLASQMYWDDQDGFAFPYRRGVTNDGDLYWFGWVGRGEEGERMFDPTAGVLWPYFASRGVEVCPALRVTAPDFKPKTLSGAGGYGYNLRLSAPAGQPCLRIASIEKPSQTLVFADAAQINDFQPPASPDRPMLEEFHYVNTSEPTVHFRHRSRAMLVFVDAHVGSEGPEPGSLDSRLPAAQVGRLPSRLIEP